MRGILSFPFLDVKEAANTARKGTGTTGHRLNGPQAMTPLIKERSPQAGDAGFEPYRGDRGCVRLRSCPFHDLAEQDRDLVCGMNERLVDGIVRGLGNDTVGVVLDPVPGECCVRLEPLLEAADSLSGCLSGPFHCLNSTEQPSRIRAASQARSGSAKG